MKSLKQSAAIFFGLAVLILLFWSPALWPGRALYFRDLSIEIIPYRSFWAASHGFALWNPPGFFGMPYAANPQTGAFYPLNFIFMLSPVWKAQAPGWLVLFDTYYPGWRALVDGKETAIERADVFFRAVPVPAGEHTVEFRYLPRSLVYGIIISGAGLMLWFALLIFAQRKWKQRSPTGLGSSFSWF